MELLIVSGMLLPTIYFKKRSKRSTICEITESLNKRRQTYLTRARGTVKTPEIGQTMYQCDVQVADV